MTTPALADAPLLGLLQPRDRQRTGRHDDDWRVLFSGGAITGTKIHNNCFEENGTGLESTNGDHTVNAENNFWGEDDGPSGVGPGPGNAALVGSGDSIVQQTGDRVDVEPFLTECLEVGA